MSEFTFPYMPYPLENLSCITSYTIEKIPNENSMNCGRYTIKRPQRSVDIYNINVTLQDVLSSYAGLVKQFFSTVQYSLFFDIVIDGYTYDVRFLSFKISNSELHKRKTISFNVFGSRIG